MSCEARASLLLNKSFMADKPPLYRQETDYSCTPACLRMVLDSLGVNKSEEDLRRLSDCLYDGTSPLGAIDAARKCGFDQTRKHNLGVIDELQIIIDEGNYPIVYLGDAPLPNRRIPTHTVVVVATNDSGVLVLDPAHGELSVARAEFEARGTERSD